MEWKYSKYVNIGNDGEAMTEDVAAEIEFIKIKGI